MEKLTDNQINILIKHDVIRLKYGHSLLKKLHEIGLYETDFDFEKWVTLQDYAEKNGYSRQAVYNHIDELDTILYLGKRLVNVDCKLEIQKRERNEWEYYWYHKR